MAQRTEPLGREPIKTAAHKPGKESVLISVGFWTPPPLPSPAPVKKVSYRGKGHLRTPKPSRLSARLATSTLARLSSCIVGVSLLTDEETPR